MAGSRLEKLGTVFERVRNLIRSGVIKPTEKPIWFDVYQAFPPKKNLLNGKPLYSARPRGKTKETVPDIFYREDEVRAKFYEQYGTGRTLDLTKSSFVSTCQRFVDKYTELKSHSELDDPALFEETGKALLAEGIVLRRRGAPPPVSAVSKDPTLRLKLTDMLAEQQQQQAVDADSTETVDHTIQTHTPPTGLSN
ncbi:28S ribosomal protein S23, mitochondrial [Solea senegalensis]|uniref:Small ribosomal subunit protein mS23 n=1 Tax=Solea senegalensis TaxID=28829 RepID=A0AAV6Q2L2_SOLSE|nr:28S ribosomal protein S23, mitochondrial [Solea senegalensis]KAG7479754.1 28S ribosomal protein S23, mitochondrial [Solea senegalensis]